MGLIIAIDALVVVLLCWIALQKGFEQALPWAAFFLILIPNESQIRLPGLFDLTTQRAIVIVLLILYLTLGRSATVPRNRAPLPFKYLIVIQVVWLFVATANSVVLTVSLKTVLSQILDFYLVFYIFAKAVSRVETVHKILFAFVAALFVCSILGVVEAYKGWSVISLFPQLSYRFDWIESVLDRGGRVQATFAHPILFGGALALAIPQAMYLLTTTKVKWQKVFLGSAIVLMFLNIYKTVSRGPWLALFFSLGLILLLGNRRLRKYLAAVAMLTIVVLLLRPGVWDTVRNLYVVTLDPTTAQGESYQWRYALYDIAQRELSRNLGRAMWGYGPESFYFLGLEGDFHGYHVKYESCDSSVVALMMETGYVGFVLTAAILLGAALMTLRDFGRIPKPRHHLCALFLANMLAFYFLMTNVLILGWGQQTYLLWVVLALALIYPRLLKAEGKRQERTELAVGSTMPEQAVSSNPVFHALRVPDDSVTA